MFFFYFPVLTWREEFIQFRKANPHKRPLNVYYGWQRLTKKAIKRQRLVVVFENSDGSYERKWNTLNRMLDKIVYTREQSLEEAESAYHNNREFSVYGFFVDDKKIKGDIDYLLELNFQSDANHVSEPEREEIRKQLKSAYRQAYK